MCDNYVTALVQDDDGLLWIGTENGLNRFDGYAFENIYEHSSRTRLLSPAIEKLRKVSGRRIGIVSKGGFQTIDPRSMSTVEYLIPDTTAFITQRNQAWDFIELEDGSIALTTASGFYVFDDQGSLRFRHDAYNLDDTRSSRILYGRDIFSIPGHLLIFIEKQGLAVYHQEDMKFHELDAQEHTWDSFRPDAQAGFWIAKAQISEDEFLLVHPTEGMIYLNWKSQKTTITPIHQVDLSNFSWQSRITWLSDSTYAFTGHMHGFFLFTLDHTGRIAFDTTEYLPHYQINTILKDRDGRIWAGTTEGLLRETLNPPFIESKGWKSDTSKTPCYSDAFRWKDKLYVSSYYDPSGLHIVDPLTLDLLDEISFFNGDIQWNAIHSIEMYHPDTLWLGSDRGVFWLDLMHLNYGRMTEIGYPDEMEEFNILGPELSDGSAWMLKYLAGILGRYRIADRKIVLWNEHSTPRVPFRQIKHIAEDNQGNVWIGGHGLTRWNHLSGDFDTVITAYSGRNRYGQDVLSMSTDQAGNLWFHNIENGLIKYQIEEREYSSLDIGGGLPSMVLNTLGPVIEDLLYVASPHHLISVNTTSMQVQILADEDNMPETHAFGRTMYYDSVANFLYTFYPNEIIRFPATRPAPAYQPGPLICTSVTVNGQRTIDFPEGELKFASTERNFSFVYSVVDFEDGGSYQFAYRLAPSDPWSSLGDHRMLYLSNLAPGKYTLEIRSTGKSNSPQFVSLPITIAAPFWQRPWFITILLLCIAGISALIFRTRVRMIRERASIDSLVARAEMKALHAQMNPHFVFNSLNSIKQMILKQEINEASRYLSDFAQLIRMTLEQSRHSFISLRHTVEYIKRYVAMEHIRNSEFVFTMYVDPEIDLDETVLPPMLIQPFIENAIWHGTHDEDQKIHVHVSFTHDHDLLVCHIEDDGVGIDHKKDDPGNGEAARESVGISNIQKRIELLNRKHNLMSSIEIQDKGQEGSTESGTSVTITLPLEIDEV